ncbi:MAG: hypothetical protein LBJ95_04210 [Oscillospiraceae bacterium]|nr:hypothetical protein [Oscillospiraceae bacterium]
MALDESNGTSNLEGKISALDDNELSGASGGGGHSAVGWSDNWDDYKMVWVDCESPFDGQVLTDVTGVPWKCEYGIIPAYYYWYHNGGNRTTWIRVFVKELRYINRKGLVIGL